MDQYIPPANLRMKSVPLLQPVAKMLPTTMCEPRRRLSPISPPNSLLRTGRLIRYNMSSVTIFARLSILALSPSLLHIHAVSQDEGSNLRLSAIRRRLSDFSGEWDGTWQADSEGQSGERVSHYTYDDDYDWYIEREGMSPEVLGLLVTGGVMLAFMILCCVCYPEILTILCQGLKNPTGAPKVANEAAAGDREGYVGGKMEAVGKSETPGKKDRTKKKKKKKQLV